MHLQMDTFTAAHIQNEDAQFNSIQKATEESEDSDAIALHKAWKNTWNKLRDNEIVIKDTYSDKCGFTQYRAEAIKKATNYIRTLGLNIYICDKRLVRIIRLKAKKTKRYDIPENTISVGAITKSTIAHIVWTYIRCYALTQEKRAIIKSERKAPDELISALTEIDAWDDLPELTGISTCPQVDINTGAVRLTDGYDETSGIYYDFTGITFIDGPQSPTYTDAIAASLVLRDLTSEFQVAAMDEALPPINDPNYGPAEERGRQVSHAAIISMILTAGLIWQCLHPIHSANAYNAGSGKSTLGKMMSRLITGDKPIIYTWPTTKEECEKTLTTIAMSKYQFLEFDNAVGKINAPLFNILASEGKINARLFGTNTQTIEATCSTLFYVNGNGLQISEDLIRRTMLVCLNAAQERSSDAKYKRTNFEEYVLENRAKIWQAIITILRYVILNKADLKDKYSKLRPLAGFERWSQIVRPACIECGWDDPAASQDVLYEADPVRQELTTVMAAWQATYGTSDVCVADVLRNASTGNKAAQQLLQTWDDTIPHRGELTARAIGAWLQRRQRRPVNGWMIIHTGRGEHGAYWRLTKHGKPIAPVPAEPTTETSTAAAIQATIQAEELPPF